LRYIYDSPTNISEHPLQSLLMRTNAQQAKVYICWFGVGYNFCIHTQTWPHRHCSGPRGRQNYTPNKQKV